MSNVVNFGRRHGPYEGLAPNEAALWRELMESWPADYFKASDLPLVAEYCRALETARELSGLLGETKDVGQMKAVLDLRDREVRRAAALSRTLRIAPQSRYHRHTAATGAARSNSAAKPWDYGNDEQPA